MFVTIDNVSRYHLYIFPKLYVYMCKYKNHKNLKNSKTLKMLTKISRHSNVKKKDFSFIKFSLRIKN